LFLNPKNANDIFKKTLSGLKKRNRTIEFLQTEIGVDEKIDMSFPLFFVGKRSLIMLYDFHFAAL